MLFGLPDFVLFLGRCPTGKNELSAYNKTTKLGEKGVEGSHITWK